MATRRRGGAKFLGGGKRSYRNEWNTAIEEVRAILDSRADDCALAVSRSMMEAADKFVESAASTGVIPVKTGNLRDSFGVGVYGGFGVLEHLAMNPKTAKKPTRTGFETFEGEVTETKFGNLVFLVDGRTELELHSENVGEVSHRLNKFLTTKNNVVAIMMLSAPYARAVHEKGYGFNEGPINEYYKALEDYFENVFVDNLKNIKF